MIIDVDICMCLRSTQKIEVPDNYNPENLEEYVVEQIVLPIELLEHHGFFGWNVDEFCVQ